MRIEQATQEEFEKIHENSKACKRGKYSRYLYNMQVGECKKFIFDDPREYRIASGAIYNVCRKYGLKATMSKAQKTVWVRKEN